MGDAYALKHSWKEATGQDTCSDPWLVVLAGTWSVEEARVGAAPARPRAAAATQAAERQQRSFCICLLLLFLLFFTHVIYGRFGGGGV